MASKEGRVIRLVTVEEIIPVAAKPVIGVHVSEPEKNVTDGTSAVISAGSRKIALTAAEQNAAGVEFYSWDFSYDKEKGFKPSIIIDKEGRQTVSLKTGTHNIAVKVVDNDGS